MASAVGAPASVQRVTCRLAPFRPAVCRCSIRAAIAFIKPSNRQTASRQAQQHRGQSVRPAAAGADATAAVASPGDYVELNYTVSLDDGTVVDSSEAAGEQACFVLGGSRAVAGFHQAAGGLAVGESRKFVVKAADAYGEHKEELIVEVPRSQAPNGLQEGQVVQLSNGMQATVVGVDDEGVTIDANHPLAGKDLTFDVELTKRIPAAELETAAFGAGCFWGVELVFQRVPGVVQTAVGYSQGRTKNPTYQEVCSGTTGHNEVVQVVYAPAEVSFDQLLDVFWSKHDPTTLNRQGNDVGEQYRSGIYYTTDAQRAAAEASKARQNAKLGGSVVTEIEPIANYSDAEEYHQQYLAKGGRFGQPQSAAKGCTDPIRCYG
ncbi:hypothetical protein ABPG77_007860 [Micractinium sp. CCAP 211/92]